MTTWGNADLLIEMLEKQLSFLQARDSERIIAATGRWLGFLRRETQLAGLVAELVEETKQTLRELTAADHTIRESLSECWDANKRLLRDRLVDVADKDQLHAFCHWDRFGEAVADRPAIKLPRWRIFDEDTSDTENLILALKSWTSWAISLTEQGGSPIDDSLIRSRDRLSEAMLAVQFNKRRLRLVFETSPGAALYRLRSTVREATPVPPKRDENGDEDAAEEYAWEVAFFERANEFATKVHGRRAYQMRHLEPDDVNAAATAIAADAELVTNDLQMRILAGRSRVALVRRYAAQCEGYDAQDLRAQIQGSHGNVERTLTLNFAKYLFQQGLTPILDPTVANLRPDVLEIAAGGLLYVEAKQYGADVSRATIVAAYRQVWSTWGRLANAHNVPEAFLLVFRVGGVRAEFPPVIRHGGRSLYSVLVDVSEAAGSREKANALSFAASELLPGETAATH